MLEPILSTLKYEISLFRKLKNSEFGYYSVYVFTLILKHYSDYLVSKQIGKPASAFNFIKDLKELNIITPEEEELVKKCIAISRRKDKLIEKHNEIDLTKVEILVNKISNLITEK